MNRPDFSSQRFGWILGAVVVVAAVVRVREALMTPLVFDEIYAVLLSRSGLSSLLHTLSLDVEQPLHFVLTWMWQSMGGEHALWIKTPAIVFSLGTVVVVALAGRQMFGAVAGLLAALMLAFQPTHVYYSQQGTFHAMLWFLLTLEVWLAWRWVERPTRSGAIAFILIGGASLYTAWFASFILTSIAVWGVVVLRREPRRLRGWLMLHGAVVLVFAPQIPTLLAQIRRDVIGEAHLEPLGSTDVREALRKLSFNISYLIVPFLLLGATVLLRGATRARAALLWTVGVFTILLPWALSVAGIHLFIVRQMLVNMPIACMAFAAGALSLGAGDRAESRVVAGTEWRRWIGPAVAALIVLFVVRAWWLHRPFEEAVRLRQAADYLAERSRPGQLVVCPEPRALLFVRHYLGELDSKLIIMPESEEFHHSDGILIVPEEWKMTPADFAEVRARRERWWGVRSQHAGRDGPEAAALLTAATGGDSVRFGRVVVWSSPPVLDGAEPDSQSENNDSTEGE